MDRAELVRLTLKAGSFAIDLATMQTCYTEGSRADGLPPTSRTSQADWQSLVDFARRVVAADAAAHQFMAAE